MKYIDFDFYSTEQDTRSLRLVSINIIEIDIEIEIVTELVILLL